MSKFSDRITLHPIWEEMKALGAVLDAAASVELIDTSSLEDIERIRSVLAYAGKRLASTDPSLLIPTTLDTLSAQFLSIRSELEGFINDHNINRFTTTQLKTDDLTIQLRNIPAPTNDDLTFVSESITSYRNNLEKHLNEIIEEHKAIRSTLKNNNQLLTKQSETIGIEQQKLSTLSSDIQSQFSATQDKRATEFSTAITDFQTKAQAVINENLTQFSNTTIATKEQLNNLLAEYSKNYELKLEQFNLIQNAAEELYKKELAKLKKNYELEAKNILTEVTEQKSKVEALVGVIGNLGVTSGYLKTANHARLMLYIWQFLTVIALGLLIWVAYKMAFPPSVTEMIEGSLKAKLDSSSNFQSLFYQGLAVRVFLSITLGVFAAYAARQADKQQKVEARNRKLALELEALGAFISPLPIEMQHSFRASLGERSFGIPDNDFEKHHERDPVSVIDLVKSKEFEELISRFVKVFKG